MALLDDVKTRLRVSGTAYNADITALISEAKAELVRAGVDSAAIVDTDPNIIRAVVAYCRANFDLTVDSAWQDVFDNQVKRLTLSEGYYVESTD